MRRPVSFLLAAVVLVWSMAGCSPRRMPPEPDEPDVADVPEDEEPPSEEPAEPDVEPVPPAEPPEADVPTPAEEPAEPGYDPLYARTEAALRLEFTDALYSLFRVELAPADVTRLDAAEVRAWLADHDEVDPTMVSYARERLGEVLDQRYTVGFLARDVVDARCARYDDVLFVPVPERFQTADRAFAGLVLKDECVSGEDALCLVCTGGRGQTEDGTRCSCVCVPSACPGTECVDC